LVEPGLDRKHDALPRGISEALTVSGHSRAGAPSPEIDPFDEVVAHLGPGDRQQELVLQVQIA
jgi:hypothetical protein